MSKLYKDIARMPRYIRIIEQYNNFKQLNSKEEIDFLKEKVDKLLKIKDTKELVKEFTWCSNMINMLYNEIDSEFKKFAVQEEIAKEKDEFGL